MMVTFVSECEKKALSKTRRVLDAFANRIGSRTWQTVITLEGLDAVKKLLRKTASKNTAVSCHWIRSRSRSELIWIVGNRGKFNEQGYVPVNFTEADISEFQDDNRWQTINIVYYAATIAGLFHDFGKANKLFQSKINPSKKTSIFEPYRHEWVSLRLFQSFVDNQTDSEWLRKLSEVSEESTNHLFRDGDGLDGDVSDNHPILTLPPFARLVAWIILSHHRLPLVPGWKDGISAANIEYVDEWLEKNFKATWNSYKCQEPDQQSRLKENWSFADKALPYHSTKWRSHACITASEAKEALASLENCKPLDFINDHLFTSHLSRLSMMLADHHYSSQKQVTHKWRSDHYNVYANTYSKTDIQSGFKQQLDEHLIGVSYHSGAIAKALPKLNRSLKQLGENKFLTEPVRKPYKSNFGWQNDAVKLAEKVGRDTLHNGFFGINMASTGKGKTIANAKIMYALGKETGRTRFSVAIGLRTLTLQTGREFQDKKGIGLNNDELAVAVGGTAVKQLFAYTQDAKQVTNQYAELGSESASEVLDEFYVDYTDEKYTHELSNWTKHNDRLEKLLCAPVLVCTIDHLIPATEGTKGGKQIGPMLRLLTSDLILDEPDDFGLKDLPALCRLVHWAAMLGSKVLLSTATMPPALSAALFQAYKAGWAQYAKANIATWDGNICCAWFDDFTTSDFSKRMIADTAIFQSQHNNFTSRRAKKLLNQAVINRLGELASIEMDTTTSTIQSFSQVIFENILKLHQRHHICREKHNVSIGLVRMANINPLVEVARRLLALDTPEDTCIHYCVYHSRYPLAVRSHIEQKLDKILMRKNIDSLWQADSEVAHILKKHPEKNHIFVVLASPVAEVGRDHDYDWAIAEPSSMRSIIQLAGRLLRHRTDIQPTTSNLMLLSKNLKALKGNEICFENPGFEMKKIKILDHDLRSCLDESQYKKITAAPRIRLPDSYTQVNETDYYTNLNSLEHKALAWQLFSGEKNAKIWWEKQPCWCGEVQRQQPFRQSKSDEAYYLYVNDEYTSPYWCWLNEATYPPKIGELSFISISADNNVKHGNGSYFWFNLNPLAIYSELSSAFNLNLTEISKNFGELRVTEYKKNACNKYLYHNNLGLYQELHNQ